MAYPPSTVLIVDDEAPCRALLGRVLEAHGMRVLTAVDGYDALAVLATTPVNLILIDLGMPHMDGRQLCSRLAADPDLREVPVVLISGHPELETESARLGARGFLKKPFRTREVVERVAQFI